jgi:hypothetical protein
LGIAEYVSAVYAGLDDTADGSASEGEGDAGEDLVTISVQLGAGGDKTVYRVGVENTLEKL